MEKLLSGYIKEIIDEYPEVGKVLEEYAIGCVTCNVGTCLLKDIIEIHNPSEDDEQIIMAKIANIVYPEREIEIPKIRRKMKPAGYSFSPPMKILVGEHMFIKRLITLIPTLCEELAKNPKNGKALARKSVEFIRSYADKFHHAKEEEILFRYFDENLDILKVMHEEHEIGRGYVRCIVDSLEKDDYKAVTEHFKRYGELLTEHIKKEDEILYPWLDRNLTTRQVGEIFRKFQEVKEQFGDSPKIHEDFVCSIELSSRQGQNGGI